MSAAELLALGDELERGPAPGAPPIQTPSPQEEAAAALAAAAAEAAPLVDLVLACAEPFAEDWTTLYTPAHRARIAETFAALCVKHGWDTGGFLERFGEEAAFGLAVLLPIGGRIAQAVRDRRAPLNTPPRSLAGGPTGAGQPAAAGPIEQGHSTAPVVLQPAP